MASLFELTMEDMSKLLKVDNNNVFKYLIEVNRREHTLGGLLKNIPRIMVILKSILVAIWEQRRVLVGIHIFNKR
jgi:hypothetical protein